MLEASELGPSGGGIQRKMESYFPRGKWILNIVLRGRKEPLEVRVFLLYFRRTYRGSLIFCFYLIIITGVKNSSPSWLQIPYVAQDTLAVPILLHLPPEGWDGPQLCASMPDLRSAQVGTEPRTSYMLGRHFTEQATLLI